MGGENNNMSIYLIMFSYILGNECFRGLFNRLKKRAYISLVCGLYTR